MKIVLIVKYESTFRDKLEDELKDKGYQSIVAIEGRHCLELISGLGMEVFDLLIVDDDLPDMGGFELVKTIRERYQDDIPIILRCRMDVRGLNGLYIWDREEGFEQLFGLLEKI